MSSTITTRVVENNIDALLKEIERDLEAAHDEATESALQLAENLVPVKTGRLRASLTATKPAPLQRKLVADVDYAAFVEYGTRTHAPRPFMTPALSLYRQILAKKLGK